MGKLHRTYTLRIRTVSPLHIGTGNTLRRNYDYVTKRGRTWVIDQEALAETLYSDSTSDFQALVDGARAGDFIREGDYDEDNPLFRYVLTGEPKARSHGAEVQELIKDVWGQPYIPGSSIKGAMRTAIGAYGLLDVDEKGTPIHRLDVQELGKNPKTAAQPLEAKVLYGNYPKPGLKPNYDLMRAVQVSDSAPDPERRMSLINVNVVTHRKTQSPIELEAIPREREFVARLTLDGYLRGKTPVAYRGDEQPPRERLGFSKDQRRWLNHIAYLMNTFSLLRIEAELKRWKDRDGAGNVRSLYDELYKIANRHVDNIEKGQFLMQLGWGTGWDSKTFSRFLRQDDGKFAAVTRRYDKRLIRQGTYQPGDRFPKSRRMVMQGDEKPHWPMGWVLVTMEENE